MLKIMFSLSKNRAVGLEFMLHNNVIIQMRPGETKAISFEKNEESERGTILNWYRERYTRLGLTVDTPNNTAKLDAQRKAQAEAAKKAEEEAKAKKEAEEKAAAEAKAKKEAEEKAAAEAKKTAKSKKDDAETVEI